MIPPSLISECGVGKLHLCVGKSPRFVLSITAPGASPETYASRA